MKLVKRGVILLVLVLVMLFILPGAGATQNNQQSENALCDNDHGSGTCNVQQDNTQCSQEHDHDYCDWHGDDPWCKNHDQGKNFVSIKNATVAASYLVSQIPSQIPEFSDWNGATVTKNTTYYDMSGVETAYSFNVTVNGQYDGYIMVSATRDNYPVLEYSKGITPDKDPNTIQNANQLAQSQITDPRFVLGEGQPIYLGPTFFDMAYPVEVNSSRFGPQQVSNNWILVDLTEGTIVNQTESIQDLFQLNMSQMQLLYTNQRIEAAGANAAWAELDQPSESGIQANALMESSVSPSSLNYVEISGVPTYHWRYGCSPTSAAMVLGYWRDQGLSQLPTDTDPAGEGDHGDPLNHELAGLMSTDICNDGLPYDGMSSNCGMTSPLNIVQGIGTELDNYGIRGWDVGSTLFNWFPSMALMINEGEPFELSMAGGGVSDRGVAYGDHSVAVVGYSTPDEFLKIHDTWNGDDPHYIKYGNWTAEMVTQVLPQTEYTITASAGPGGTISPSGSVSVFPAFSKTFTISPNSGYAIADVQINSGTSQAKDLGAAPSYTFNDIQGDQTISATFEQIPQNQMTYDWSTQGWSNWQFNSSSVGTSVGPNSGFYDIENGVGVFGTNTNLVAGNTESWVSNTFTDSTGVGWNTLTFTGALGPSDVPGGRWMTISVNGQQVFGATELQTPPGNTGQTFTIPVSIPQTTSAQITISQGQNPAWGPSFPMYCNKLILSNGNAQQANAMTALAETPKTTFTIPDGSEWAGNTTNSTSSPSG